MKHFILFVFVLLLVSCSTNRNFEYKIFSDQYKLPVTSSPIIENGVVYVGSFDHDFYAVNAKTGEEIWRFETSKPIFSSPFVNEDSVVFVSYDGYLYCLNKKTGKLKWKYLINNLKPYVNIMPFVTDMQNFAATTMAFWRTPQSLGGAGHKIQYFTPESIRRYIGTDLSTQNAKYFISVFPEQKIVAFACYPHDKSLRRNYKKRMPTLILHLDKNGGVEIRSRGFIAEKDGFDLPWLKTYPIKNK